MVAMAFLAVLREGLETVVFLLAAFNESDSGAAAPLGALFGILVAVGLGYGIYRGGVRINLSKFFRATGLVLVLVAAGLVVSALHTAHEAGWINIGQGRTVDLTWLVKPGSVQSSLLTGMLGIQPHPVVIEVIGWLVYLIPVGLYVAWPPGRGLSRRALSRTLLAGGAAAAIATHAFAVFCPARPAAHPVTSAGTVSAALVSRSGDDAVVRTQLQSPAGSGVGEQRDIAVQRSGAAVLDAVPADVYTAKLTGDAAETMPATLSLAKIAELNGGRLPIGLRATTSGSAPVAYSNADVLTLWVEPRTGRVLNLSWDEQVTATVTDPTVGALALSEPVAKATAALPAATVSAAAAATAPAIDTIEHRSTLIGLAWFAGVLAVALLATGGLLAARARTGRPKRSGKGHPAGQLVSG
jgi:high-affinity iron transporter